MNLYKYQNKYVEVWASERQINWPIKIYITICYVLYVLYILYIIQFQEAQAGLVWFGLEVSKSVITVGID